MTDIDDFQQVCYTVVCFNDIGGSIANYVCGPFDGGPPTLEGFRDGTLSVDIDAQTDTVELVASWDILDDVSNITAIWAVGTERVDNIMVRTV